MLTLVYCRSSVFFFLFLPSSSATSTSASFPSLFLSHLSIFVSSFCTFFLCFVLHFVLSHIHIYTLTCWRFGWFGEYGVALCSGNDQLKWAQVHTSIKYKLINWLVFFSHAVFCRKRPSAFQTWSSKLPKTENDCNRLNGINDISMRYIHLFVRFSIELNVLWTSVWKCTCAGHIYNSTASTMSNLKRGKEKEKKPTDVFKVQQLANAHTIINWR